MGKFLAVSSQPLYEFASTVATLCGVVPSACSTVVCGGGDPSVELTVTNLGAVEVVNWCGEVWNLPADNGVVKCVCPTNYIKDQYTGTTLGYTAYKAAQKWQYNNSLVMHRGYMAFKNTFTPLVYRANFTDADHRNVNFLKINADVDSVAGQNIFGQLARPVPVTYYFPPASNIGKVAPETVLAVAPSDGAATLTADFFGSHTIASVTYSWAQGNGW
jgi:hypothetical protein